ncbi:hypothetical protein SCUP515_00236 [Seiridium cupressi]
MLDLSSLRLQDLARLEELPLDVLLIIFSYLDTAKSVAGLATTCKKLHSVAQASGWRIFVRSHFESLSPPQDIGDDEWMGWARTLTSQSRGWDRRALSAASFVASVRKPPRDANGRRRFRMQTIPPHIVVDASANFKGPFDEETVAWGAGEDVVVRRRQFGHSRMTREDWMAVEGKPMGFTSGQDDVTAISILNAVPSAPGLLVGRASGHLQLLSMSRIMDRATFDCVGATFRPSLIVEGGAVDQRDIQAFDTNKTQDTVAVVTKDNVLFYPLDDTFLGSAEGDAVGNLVVAPEEALNVRNIPESRHFGALRTLRFMGNGNLALGLAGSPEPLRYFTRTPTGLELINAAKLQPSNRCTSSYIYRGEELQSVRGLLPTNISSVAGGSGNVVLSSHDDGTIRLQDLRSPCAADTIYQDHFEVLTPVGPLVSHGMERFIAGSARTSILKIFDFRWTKSYNYTESLPCGRSPLLPLPKPPTFAASPYHCETERCNHLLGRLCNRHVLAKTDFYRPNCNVYLPLTNQSESPIYSLAKPSDVSPNIYAGLAGELVKVSLRDQGESTTESRFIKRNDRKYPTGYTYHESPISIIETGNGIALSDISKSQRMPEIRKQDYTHSVPATTRRTRRLDHLLL